MLCHVRVIAVLNVGIVRNVFGIVKRVATVRGGVRMTKVGFNVKPVLATALIVEKK